MHREDAYVLTPPDGPIAVSRGFSMMMDFAGPRSRVKVKEMLHIMFHQLLPLSRHTRAISKSQAEKYRRYEGCVSVTCSSLYDRVSALRR